MVRRRSTVRFRNGAPGQRDFFELANQDQETNQVTTVLWSPCGRQPRGLASTRVDSRGLVLACRAGDLERDQRPADSAAQDSASVQHAAE